MKCLNLLLVAALTFASSAPAATKTAARQAYARYTECPAKRNPKDARRVVLSTIPNRDILKSYPSLITPDCLDVGSLTLPGDFIRYGLAEALVRRDLAAGLPADIGQAAPLEHAPFIDDQPMTAKKLKPKEAQRLDKQRLEAAGFRYLSMLGECVVRKDPPAALRLVLSKPNSGEELRAFEPLKISIASCIIAGQTLAFDQAALRGSIAMNLYRLANAPRVLPATTPR